MLYSNSKKGFFSKSIHGEKVPEDSVELDDSDYQKILDWQSKGGVFIGVDQGGSPILEDSPTTDLFEMAFNVKYEQIIFNYKKALSPISAKYTKEDIASFPVQEAEAKAWNADNTVETPLLDYMLANRPTVDKATLVSRILQNAVVYKQIAGPAIGKKQYLEDQLYALKAQHEDPDQPDVTQADIDAIVVDFSTD